MQRPRDWDCEKHNISIRRNPAATLSPGSRLSIQARSTASAKSPDIGREERRGEASETLPRFPGAELNAMDQVKPATVTYLKLEMRVYFWISSRRQQHSSNRPPRLETDTFADHEVRGGPGLFYSMETWFGSQTWAEWRNVSRPGGGWLGCSRAENFYPASAVMGYNTLPKTINKRAERGVQNPHESRRFSDTSGPKGNVDKASLQLHV